jgi:hypothetical protein
MRANRTAWPPSAIMLLIFGVVLVLMGLYFLVLRPSLLPEDMRYIGASQAQIESSAPRLANWLGWVFGVMGGYISATGILAITLAATSFRDRDWRAVAGVLIAGLGSIGWMTVVNFLIDSDFRWVLLGIALFWVSSIGLFCFEAGSCGDKAA